jgi:hypothetical protein
MKPLLHGNLNKEELDNLYLWRYINSEKLLDFIQNRQLHFSRLDQFEDPLEGLENQARYNLKLHNTTNNEQILSFFKLQSKGDIEKWQNGIFASCWFLPTKDTESLAMWNLYSNNDGFAIKIKLGSIVDAFISSIENLDDLEITDTFYGKVNYWDYFAVPSHASLHSNLLTSMIKTPDYEHEKEFRFVLLRKAREHSIQDRRSIKIILGSEIAINTSIIAHANMGELTFNLFKGYLKDFGYTLVRSKILTRKVVDNLIQKSDESV